MNVKACYGMYDFVFTTLIYAHAFPRAKLEPASRSGRPRHHGDQPGKLLRNARLRGIFPSSRSATVRAAYGFAARGEEDDLVECLRTQFHIEAVKTSSRQRFFPSRFGLQATRAQALPGPDQILGQIQLESSWVQLLY